VVFTPDPPLLSVTGSVTLTAALYQPPEQVPPLQEIVVVGAAVST